MLKGKKKFFNFHLKKSEYFSSIWTIDYEAFGWYNSFSVCVGLESIL